VTTFIDTVVHDSQKAQDRHRSRTSSVTKHRSKVSKQQSNPLKFSEFLVQEIDIRSNDYSGQVMDLSTVW